MFWALAILKACPADTWRLLLDKLGKVPVSSFDEADQHQMYQVHLLLDIAGLPPPLLAHMAYVCTAHLQHLQSPSAASAMPICSIWNHHLHQKMLQMSLAEPLV